MIREAPAMTVRQNLGELLNEVQYRGDSVVITKGGKPVAALVDIALFENIRRMRDDFDRMCDELVKIGDSMTEEEVQALVDEAVSEVRREMRAEQSRQQS